MAILHQRLFSDISKRDFLEYIWTGEGEKGGPKSVQRNVDHFNRLSEWVSSEIVLGGDEGGRVEALKQMITLAEVRKEEEKGVGSEGNSVLYVVL